jgi:hypothetical protein
MAVAGPAGERRSLHIDVQVFDRSVHGSLGCVDCHTGIGSVPHATHTPPVVRGTCYEDVVASYRNPGEAVERPEHFMPACRDRHGTHDFLRASDRVLGVDSLGVMPVVHLYEAILAGLAILIWPPVLHDLQPDCLSAQSVVVQRQHARGQLRPRASGGRGTQEMGSRA